MPIEFFVEKNFDIWDPKIHGMQGKKALSICRDSKWYLKKGKDHLIMK